MSTPPSVSCVPCSRDDSLYFRPAVCPSMICECSVHIVSVSWLLSVILVKFVCIVSVFWSPSLVVPLSLVLSVCLSVCDFGYSVCISSVCPSPLIQYFYNVYVYLLLPAVCSPSSSGSVYPFPPPPTVLSICVPFIVLFTVFVWVFITVPTFVSVCSCLLCVHCLLAPR